MLFLCPLYTRNPYSKFIVNAILKHKDKRLLIPGSGKTRRRRVCRKRSLARLKELAMSSSVVQQNVAPGVPDSAFTMPVPPELGTEDSPHNFPDCMCRCVRLNDDTCAYGGQSIW